MCAINLQKIKDLAKLKNISIRELAFKIGCTDGGLYKMINNNKISVDTLQAIAEALEVNIGVFFDEFTPNVSASAPHAVAIHGDRNNVQTIAETFASLLQEKDKQIYITQGQMDRLIEMLDESHKMLNRLIEKQENELNNED